MRTQSKDSLIAENKTLAHVAQHTPGPWRVGDNGLTVFGPKTDQPSPVAVASLPGPTPRVNAEERKANARLIASTPRLLAEVASLVESLKSAEHKIKTAMTFLDGEPGEAVGQAHNRMYYVLRDLRAAIAKAEGSA